MCDRSKADVLAGVRRHVWLNSCSSSRKLPCSVIRFGQGCDFGYRPCPREICKNQKSRLGRRCFSRYHSLDRFLGWDPHHCKFKRPFCTRTWVWVIDDGAIMKISTGLNDSNSS
jgi:hypothetical protein